MPPYTPMYKKELEDEMEDEEMDLTAIDTTPSIGRMCFSKGGVLGTLVPRSRNWLVIAGKRSNSLLLGRES